MVWVLVIGTGILLLALGLNIATLLVSNRVVAAICECVSRVLWIFTCLLVLLLVLPSVRKLYQEYGLTVPSLTVLVLHVGEALVRFLPITLIAIWLFGLANSAAFICLAAYDDLPLAKVLSAAVSGLCVLLAVVVLLGLAVPIQQLITGLS